MHDDIIYILQVAIGCCLGAAFLQLLIPFTFSKLKNIEEKRRKTIISALHSVISYAALLTGLILIAANYVELSKVLASAGLIGAVLGFGAQSLIRDMLSGFFFIYEKQINNGESITINGKHSGVVEEVGLRVLLMRQHDGKLLSIANSEIKTIENQSRETMMVSEKIIVSFRENPKTVLDLIEGVCEKLNNELRDSEGIIEPFKSAGISALTASVNGYEYTIGAKVSEASFGDLSQKARQQLAISFFEAGVRLSEQQHHYKTVVEHKK
jgi:small-conductance mechanosensitive channel